MARNLFNTGDNRTSISDSEKAAFGSGTVNAFNVTWGILKGLIQNSFTSLKIGGVTRIDASGNVTATNVRAITTTALANGLSGWGTGYIVASPNAGSDTGAALGFGYNTTLGQGEITSIAPNVAWKPLVLFSAGMTFNASSGAGSTLILNSDNTATFASTVTATGYLPFTGCHIAKSKENLKLGELVQIRSVGWIDDKQPDWEASYCNESKKGIYGIVYDIINVEDEETIYHIAATGDGFITVDCPCEYGDVLIPSKTKGLATVYKGEYLPLNMVGFAGEDSEGGKIAYTKE